MSRTVVSDEAAKAAGAEPVRGDILDRASLPGLLAGVEVVFHVAGVNEMCSRDPSAMVRANVEGSVNMIDAAIHAGVRRVVYTSSAAALGERQGTVGTEASPHRGWYLSEYERSKHLAERAVMARQGVEIVTVNPSSVQGPGRTTGTGKIVLDVVRGRLPLLVDTSLSIVDIDDCARGHLAAAAGGTPGTRYVLNSFSISMPEAVGLLDELVELRRVRYLPRAAVTAAGWVGEVYGRWAGKPAPLCRELTRTLLHGHRYDGSRAVRELGLQYTRPEALLGRLVDWYRDEGLV